MLKRKLDCWVAGFAEYTEGLPSPPLFKKWAAISIIAGALERKVWVDNLFGILYPNLYVFLVAPPGVGKSILTNRVMDLWRKLDGHYLAATSVSKASMIDDLRDATRNIIRPNCTPGILSFNSLKIVSNELAVLIPSYENDFMYTLTDIYDCHSFSERKRSRDLKYELDAPQINMIAATTPNYLASLLPEGAWDQGFLSRTLLIYSGEVIKRPMFGEKIKNEKVLKKLTADLRIIGDIVGELIIDEETQEAIDYWQLAGGPPAPEHPKLVHYNTRRGQHLLKLCMVASMSESDELVITIDHYAQALNWLLEYEVTIPDIFKQMAVGGDARIIDETWHFVYTCYIKEDKPIIEHRIVHFLQERVPAHSITRILEVMLLAKILERKIEPGIGNCYIPKNYRGD